MMDNKSNNINTLQKEIYERLPLMSLENNFSFFDLDKDKSQKKIDSLINKYIFFDLKENDGVSLLVGKLVDFKNNHLKIIKHTTKPSEDKEYKEWLEEIDLNNILGIQEYKKVNPNLEFKSEFKNNICEITRNGQKEQVLIKDYDSYEVEMDIKYMKDDVVYINNYYFPLYLIENIELISYK